MKKWFLLLITAFMLQSCFTTRPVAVQSELQQTHIGRSSTNDLLLALGSPTEKYSMDTGSVWVYYKEQQKGSGKITTTSRFIFDEKGIVRNVISDDFTYRKQFDGRATALLIILDVVASVVLAGAVSSAIVNGY